MSEQVTTSPIFGITNLKQATPEELERLRDEIVRHGYPLSEAKRLQLQEIERLLGEPR